MQLGWVILVNDMFSFQREVEAVTLSEWIEEHSSEEELRSLFLNLDIALKYIHDHGYCIEVFYPTEIEILNNNDKYICFRKLMELSPDIERRKQMIQEDILHSAFVQLGIYSNSLKYLSIDFLRENFDSFTQFIPADDVPYYRGVILRNASVYYCEYRQEKNSRDLQNLEKELNVNDYNKNFIKEKGALTNDKINDKIYRQINGLNDKAFVYSLIIPTISLVFLLLIGIVMWIFSFV